MVSKRRKVSIFNVRVTSKRRAEIISIRSPTAFRKSIRTLLEGRYSLGDQRALQLAQNRATAQLRRRNLSARERRQFREISKIRIPPARRIFLTSLDDGHRHLWSPVNETTSINDGHRHRVDLKRKLALKKNGHTHKLLRRRT